jgi:predicted regulator of Ras-like GTPase activity (Roadblock/LC7/MglB family)
MRTLRSSYSTLLDELSRHRGVVAALVVSERDGIPIDSTARVGIDIEALAALGTSLHRKASLAGRAALDGELSFVQLEAERGRICITGRADMELLIVALAEPRANPGLLRVALLAAAKALS